MKHFSNKELEEFFKEQYREMKQIEQKLDKDFPYKYFLNYSLNGVGKCHFENFRALHRRHSLKVATEVRGHFFPLLLVPVNGEREHLHAQGRSDVNIPIQVFRDAWGYKSHGSSVFRIWDEELDGQSYFFKHNKWDDTIHPYCGVNKKPCRTKKGNKCKHKDILNTLREQ